MDLEFRQLQVRLIHGKVKTILVLLKWLLMFISALMILLRKENDCFFQMEAWLYVKTEGTLEVSLNFMVPLEKQSIGLAKNFLANPIYGYQWLKFLQP